MKARLVEFEGTLKLLLCTGKIKTISQAEAYEFLSNFDDPNYYAGTGTWDYEDLSMEEFRGETVAYVTDAGELCMLESRCVRDFLQPPATEWLSVNDYAELHSRSVTLVRRLCRTGRIPGTLNIGTTWIIPKDAPYPADERFRK